MARDRYYDDTDRPQRNDDKYFANMPDKVVMKEYPKPPYGLEDYYDDNPAGIDELAVDNYKRVNRNKDPQNRGGLG